MSNPEEYLPSEPPLSPFGREAAGEGLKRCPKCGHTKPFTAFPKSKAQKDGLQGHCKACRAAYAAANREAKREYDRARYAANREARLEYNRAWRAANREARLEYNRAWKAAHPEADAAHRRAQRAAHPEVMRASVHRRRASIKANGGNVTAHELAAKRASQHGFCAYCQMPHAPSDLTIDHVIPIDQGGPHIIANIVFACGVCNSSKGNRTPDQWTDRWYERSSDQKTLRPRNRKAASKD